MPSTTLPKPIKLGFVGLSKTGWASNVLAPAITQQSMREHFDLVAISTTNEASANASAEKYAQEIGHPIKAYYGDTSKIAADPDVDFVAVSVKASYHKQAILPIIQTGKPFFVEWPVGAGIQDTLEIAQAAREKGAKSIVGLQGRQSRVLAKVKEILKSGKIGDVRSSSIIGHIGRELQVWGPSAKENLGYYLKSTGGTPLSIPLGHVLDMFTNLLGDFKTIRATNSTVYPVTILLDDEGKPNGKTHPAEFPDHYSISGALKSGVIVNIFYRFGYASTPGRRQFLWEIDGDEGSIRLEAKDIASLSEPDLYVNDEKVEFGEGPSGNIYSVANAWTAFAEGKEGSYATLDDAVKNHQLLAAIEKSGETGVEITF